jgi:ABC-2 type transport system ATP-binding protein
MSTPYLDEAERCSRVALLHNGQLLALDRPDALRQTLPGSLYEVIAPDHRRAVAALRSLSDVADVQTFGERAHVRLVDTGPDPVGRLARQLRAAGVEVTTIRQVPPSLEDVFVTRLGETQS